MEEADVARLTDEDEDDVPGMVPVWLPESPDCETESDGCTDLRLARASSSSAAFALWRVFLPFPPLPSLPLPLPFPRPLAPFVGDPHVSSAGLRYHAQGHLYRICRPSSGVPHSHSERAGDQKRNLPSLGSFGGVHLQSDAGPVGTKPGLPEARFFRGSAPVFAEIKAWAIATASEEGIEACRTPAAVSASTCSADRTAPAVLPNSSIWVTTFSVLSN